MSKGSNKKSVPAKASMEPPRRSARVQAKTEEAERRARELQHKAEERSAKRQKTSHSRSEKSGAVQVPDQTAPENAAERVHTAPDRRIADLEDVVASLRTTVVEREATIADLRAEQRRTLQVHASANVERDARTADLNYTIDVAQLRNQTLEAEKGTLKHGEAELMAGAEELNACEQAIVNELWEESDPTEPGPRLNDDMDVEPFVDRRDPTKQSFPTLGQIAKLTVWTPLLPLIPSPFASRGRPGGCRFAAHNDPERCDCTLAAHNNLQQCPFIVQKFHTCLRQDVYVQQYGEQDDFRDDHLPGESPRKTYSYEYEWQYRRRLRSGNPLMAIYRSGVEQIATKELPNQLIFNL